MENECNKLLEGGLYKYINVVSTGTLSIDLKEYLSSDKFREDYSSGKWSGGLSIGPLGLGANSSSEEIHKFQESIRVQRSLTLDQAFYDNLVYCAPDINLAQQFVECIKANRKQGFIVDPMVSDTEITFNLEYRQKFRDPLPEIVTLRLTNGKKTAEDIEGPGEGDILDEETQISCSRNPNEDVILSIDTTRESVYIRIPANPKPRPSLPRKILYKVNVTRADNLIKIFTSTDGKQVEFWETGVIHQDPALDKNYYPRISPSPSKNELRVQGFNSPSDKGANPYNLRMVVSLLEKVGGKITATTVRSIQEQGNAGAGMILEDVIVINPPAGAVVVYNEAEL